MHNRVETDEIFHLAKLIESFLEKGKTSFTLEELTSIPELAETNPESIKRWLANPLFVWNKGQFWTLLMRKEPRVAFASPFKAFYGLEKDLVDLSRELEFLVRWFRAWASPLLKETSESSIHSHRKQVVNELYSHYNKLASEFNSTAKPSMVDPLLEAFFNECKRRGCEHLMDGVPRKGMKSLVPGEKRKK